MKNFKQNLYKNIFIISCLIWAIFILFVLFNNINKKEQNKDFINIESKVIEEDNICYSQATSYSTFEFVPFFEISELDRYTIECIVAGESKGESIRGKKLVAQCIMNAMIRDDWDAETVRIQYKYAGWDSELENTNPELWTEVEFAVSEVFDKGNLETYEPILYFYAPKWSSGSWHENNLEYVLTEGGHKFFKLPEE